MGRIVSEVCLASGLVRRAHLVAFGVSLGQRSEEWLVRWETRARGVVVAAMIRREIERRYALEEG